MKVLITGANGFIGRHVVRKIQTRGDHIIGTDLQATAYEKEIQYIQADITDYKELTPLLNERYDCIIHLAACVSMESTDTLRINIAGTYNILKVANQVGCQSFLHLSSVPIIGSPPNIGFVTEDTPANPRTLYHISKYTAEQLVMLPEFTAMKRYNLRIASPIGSGMPNHFLMLMLSAAKEGKQLTLYGTGSRVQNYIDVRDIAEAVSQILGKQPPEGLYLLGGHSYSNLEAARLCLSAVKSKREIVFVDTPDPADGERWLLDDKKAQIAFGYVPRYSLEESLIAILE